ncbi:MAG: histidine ammonia-lyase [Planctomycetota bacterium]
MTDKRTLELDGRGLDLASLSQIAAGTVKLALAESALPGVAASRDVVDGFLAGDETAYGVNTGFGRFCQVRISADQVRDLQRNLVLSHGAGVGQPLPDDVVRLSVALRANTLARGNSGIRRETIELLLSIYNEGIVPWIPAQGSVGACGDLAPLAHLAQVLIGEGRAHLGDGIWQSAAAALQARKLQPVELQAKEGLSLINGVQVSCAWLAQALLQAQQLLSAANFNAAATVDALLGSATPFDARIQEVRPHPGQGTVAATLRDLLHGSEILASHVDCGRVQDAYSLRCVPQVHGAVLDSMNHVQDVLLRECNSSTDNPLIFADDTAILSGGNFHGAPIAYAADLLSIVLTDLGSISERRIERLVNPDLSGLPAFLSADEGLQSGYMMAQVTAAALVSECKVLAHPASVDSVPTSAGTEDHVSMSTHAARKACEVAANVANILAIELLVAREAVELRRPLRSSEKVEAGLTRFQKVVPRVATDRPLTPEIEATAEFLFRGGPAGE